MHDMKKNIRRIFWLYFVMFLVVVVYLGNLILIESATMINSTFNPRLNRNNFTIKRGYIFDAHGNILAESVRSGDIYSRVYPYGNDFAHTVGFIGITKSGVEARHNFTLDNLDFEIIQRIRREFIDGSSLQGDNIHLTIEQPMQSLAAESLRGIRGGIAAIEPQTGRIIAMVSSPDFDPNNIGGIWGDLVADEENSPLLNRAAQGLYPPGSIFKLITADAIMNHMDNYEDFHVECAGTAHFNGESLRCFDARAHGNMNLSDAMKYSCNIFFAAAIIEIGYDKLMESAERMGFNTPHPFDLEFVISRFNMDENADIGEIMQTSIGQGRTLVTPLHMALVTAAVANDGIMMEPYIVERITSHTGRVKWEYGRRQTLPRPSQIFTSQSNADKIKEMMVEVVAGGTGTAARVAGITVAGKTGTAENPAGDAHGWFIAFAPAENPKIALAVLTENTGGTRRALEIARNMLEAYFE
ncbi:MAG: penicillin-binding transpeptidase domain-containing protein [Defluviitaleaceae bacterium]|nr:penicillin-binding transpeptidase domain-containing protein [Defluviitaleaceae bacterium]